MGSAQCAPGRIGTTGFQRSDAATDTMAAKALSNPKTASKPPAAKKASSKRPASKPKKSSKAAGSGKAIGSGKATGSGGGGAASSKARAPVTAPKSARAVFLPRAVANIDDEDVLMAHGGGGGGFGRCGGRLLSSKIEQSICHKLGLAGVVHSHGPRHYEIRFDDNRVAAYAPMIVLRGRGREGKSVVIEAVEDADAPILRKVVAFRAQYGQEFYIIFVANDDVLDEVTLTAYDESCAETNVNTLIARLAE